MLGILKNRVLREIFGSVREGLTRIWRKWRNLELCNVYRHRLRRMSRSGTLRWAVHVARTGEMINVYRLGRNPVGSGTIRIHGRRGSIILKLIEISKVKWCGLRSSG
jgi:hypothetical protein